MGDFLEQFNVNSISHREFHKNTVKYIKDNQEYVARANRMMLIRVSSIVEILLLIYFILSFNVFESWNVTDIYAANLIINGVFLIIFWLSYWKREVPVKNTIRACELYQFYVMVFLVVISLAPLDMESPAVYFASLGIVFAVVFIVPWYNMVSLFTIECAIMIVASYLLKSKDIFSINFFSSIVACFVFCYVARNLYDFRIAESIAKGKLKDLAGIDKLTGLYNKGNMENLCFEYFDHNDENVAIMIIDFDNFKVVNDTFGHQQGDQVLKAFGTVLKRCAKEKDLVGRIGGDEFMIMVTGNPTEDEVSAMADRIVEETHNILSSELVFEFSCSIGIAFRNQKEGASYDMVFSYADRALYQTKENGKNGKSIFTTEMLSKHSFKTILLVDSLKVSRALLVSCLERNYHLYEVNNGLHALKLLEGRNTLVDTVIIDVDPSNSHIQELLDLLKDFEGARDKVVFLVRNKHQEIHYDLEGLNIEYIEKPIDTMEVANRVRKVMG
ncbi:MAG: diguanylate cyclase [Lachnospiraceae bacterium]|nr:diguanylate cyclase [Lachnospiraceae bacterium]